MSTRRLWAVLLLFTVVVSGVFVANIAADNTPSLGLDLQGGASVTLTPVGEFEAGALDAAVEVIRRRVDSIGVAEPEIIRQGNTVVVNLPGVENQDEALALIGRTGAVEMRPVLNIVEQESPDNAPTTTTGEQTSTTLANPSGGVGESRRLPSTADTDTSVPSEPGTGEAGTEDEVPVPLAAQSGVPSEEGQDGSGLPPGQTVLPGAKDGLLYLLGPAEATGEVFSSDASVQVDQGAWVVTANLRGGASGADLWNALAARCFAGGADCPTKQIAIILDGAVISAPVVQVPSFSGSVQISGDFTEAEANDLAKILQFGAVPVDFDAPTVQSVSATLGKDSLDAAILAGLFGVALVLFFLFAYYRLLAVVAIGGLVVSGMLLWSVIAWLSRTNGLAFTLSGAAGVIVSIGTGADSYIMLFERLKEDIRAGRTLRNSAVRSFENSWRTIIVANTSTLIGAVILWWLSIGSVRGFAFFLGLSSLTSMIAVYFFTRPAVLLIANWHRLNARGVLGVKSSQVLGGEKS
jgi:preprotein translocase subunit SecD